MNDKYQQTDVSSGTGVNVLESDADLEAIGLCFPSAFRYSHPMLDTDSALLNLIVAPVLAAALLSRPMLGTDSATTRLSHPSWLQYLRFLAPLILAMRHTHLA